MDFKTFFEETFPAWLIDEVNNIHIEEQASSNYEVEWEDSFYDFVNDTDNFAESIEDHFKGIFSQEHIVVRNGVSKIVLVGPDSVYKLLINCEEIEEFESKVYEKATYAGVADYFAKTSEDHEIELFNPNGDSVTTMYWYKQEKIACDRLGERFMQDNIDLEEVMYEKTSRNVRSNFSCNSVSDNEALFYTALARTNRSDVEKMVSFLKKLHINDLHTGNFVVVKGVPVLFDFSGYCEY